MQGMDFKPLEITDFSGGTTENILQGDPRRAAKLDNYFITVDKKLEERYPFVPIDFTKYITPAGNQAINGMYNFISETELMAQSNRSLFAIDPATDDWVSILGPNGAEPIQGGDLDSQTTYAEFQKQIYFTNDGINEQGTLPSKIYRNENNQWVARTAGLPRSYVGPNYTEATLLAKCIAIANDLRSAMIAHISSARYPTYTPAPTNPFVDPYYDDINIHVNIDKYSLSYFSAQSFTGYPEIPSPIPTPAPIATDQASLFTLVGALSSAYSHHVEDSMKGSLSDLLVTTGGVARSPYYHFNIFYPNGFVGGPAWFPVSGIKITRGPGAILDLQSSPDDLETCATQLDELLQKWNWHRKGVNIHSPKNDPVQFDKFPTTQTAVGRVNLDETYPTITPDYTDLFNYANNVKYLFNQHINAPTDTQRQSHTQPDNYLFGIGTRVSLADVNNLDDYYLLIYWLRAMYATHSNDAFINAGGNQVLTVNTTANSATITGTWTGLGPFIVATTAAFKAVAGSGYGTTSYLARVLTSGVNTATIDRQAVATGALPGTFSSSSRYHAFKNATTGAYIVGQPSDPSQLLASAADSIGISISNWNDLLTEVYLALSNHAAGIGYGNRVHSNQAGTWMPYFQANTATPFYIPDVATYVYAFYFSDEYTVEPNGLDYLVQGNPIFSDPVEAVVSYPVNFSIPSKYPLFYTPVTISAQATVSITNLPTLTNNSNTNYDLNDIQLNIYRTLDSGTTYYELAQVLIGTTSYVDNVNDTIPNPNELALDERQILYTSGGVVGSDQPPRSKYIHILDGVVYYGGIWDGDQFFPNRIRQSVQFAPDWAPATFYDDLDDELTGISSTKSNVIAFCKNSVYRMSGIFNSLGQGALIHTKIADTLGCLNAKSIVKTEIGVFFAGTDGFYYTDGFQMIKISIEHNKAYFKNTRTKSQKDNIYGGYDKTNRRVWWSMREDQTDTCNNVSFVFYLDYGTKPSGVFTHIRNGLNYRPSSHVFQDGIYYYGHEQGFIMKSDALNKSDAEINVDTQAQDWNTIHIPFEWRSVAIDMGSTYKRKWMTKAHVVGENQGNVLAEIIAIRDLDEGRQKAMAPINFIDNPVWGTPIYIWGDETCKWEYGWTNDIWRRFPRTTLRSDFMQLKLVPYYGNVYASSVNFPEFSNAVIDAALKTATIQTPSGYSDIVWPLDVVGYKIAFQIDDYEKEFEISVLDSTKKIITFLDPDGYIAANSTQEWVIRGYKKNQKSTINSLALHFAFLGDENQSYPGPNSNDGPGNAGGNP